MPEVSLNGAELYYEIHEANQARQHAGKPPAVVLAHGVGGNHAIWFQQIDAFRQFHRVITFDHRGFGNSSDPQGSGRSAHAQDLLALLDYLDIERTALVGQSMGGGTCIGVVAQAAERVSALVLADTLHGIRLPARAAEIMQQAKAATANLGQIERVLGSNTRHKDPAKATLYRQINSFNATDRRNLQGSYPKLLSPEELAATGIPILFIAGEDDVLFPVTAIQDVQASVSGSKWIEMKGVGHSAFYEDPESFNRHVLEFLNGY